MIRRHRNLLVVVLAATMLLTVGPGCGSSSGEEVTAPTVEAEPTATAPAPTPTPTGAPPATAPTPTPVPSTPPPVPPTPPPATPTPDSTAPPQPPSLHVLGLYWVRDGALAAGGSVEATDTPERTAVELLLRGPMSYEDREGGMETAIADGVTLLDLSITDGRAIVDLSSDFEAVSLGSSGELAMVAQVVFTLTRFPTVETVDIHIDGEAREVILGHGLGATDLTRNDFFDAVAPSIVVESPIPGQVVWAPFQVTGFSRTFESNVQWELVDRDGAVLTSGFTTAQQPDVGRHGPFEFVVDVEPNFFGVPRLIVFEESAKDGSRIGVYEVPVFIQGARPAPTGDDALPWLRVGGFGPVDFDTPVDQALTVLEPTFGPPNEPTSSIECGSGVAGQVVWDDFTLNLGADDTVVGWFYRYSDPPLTTATGIAPGSTRDQLLTAYPDTGFSRDNLGTEAVFTTPDGTLAGFVTDDGDRVTALHDGATCFFD